MNVLLVYPPDIHMITTEIPQDINKNRGYLPPLGLLSIASYLKKYTNHTVQVVDAQVERMSYKKLLDVIHFIKPDIVGIYASTFSFIDGIQTASGIRKILPNTHIVLGGPHVTLYPKETLSFSFIDYVVIGEGEQVFCELVEAIGAHEEIGKISGIGYKRNGSIYVSQDTAIIENLDELPIPDRTMTPYKKYYSILSHHYPVTTIMTSRGCPYGCIFCHEAGIKFRTMSPQRVIAEIKDCLALNIREIFFHDDTFTVVRQRVIDICQEIIRSNLKFDWDVRGRVNTVDRELLILMKKAGCTRISFGVESGSQEVLDRLKKGITLDQIKAAFKHTREAGITSLADFMIGSPGEGEHEISLSFALMKEINPDFVHFSITTPYPGTRLYNDSLKHNHIKKDMWKDFAEHPDEKFVPALCSEVFNREELMNWVTKAYAIHYLNPHTIMRAVMRLRSFKEFKDKTTALFNIIKARKKKYQ
ncbi:MAG: radical SAM protein [Elusimicrobia bacterium]|nr:radical SAM protein [Elusimicrobiota bacterium]